MFNKMLLIVLFFTLVFIVSCKNDPTSPKNTEPIALFSVDPTFGSVATIFNFDGNESNDNEDEISALQFRWDFTNDGTYDTNWMTNAKTTHKYTRADNYTIMLQVKDSGDLTNTVTNSVNVVGFCLLPEQVSLSNPLNDATIVPISPTLYWEALNEATSYTLQVDDNSNFSSPIVNLSNYQFTSKQISGLSLGATYYWRVLAGNSCGDGPWSRIWSFTTTNDPGTVTDIDGNVYTTVQIGSQIWMAENLRVTHFRRGDPISNILDNTEWENLTIAAYCNYDNDENYVSTYGRLYNFYAVNSSGGLAPAGWHIPSEEEWDELETYLGTDAGAKLKEAGFAHWLIPYDNGTGGSNSSGFSAVPGGFRDSNGGIFAGIGYETKIWTNVDNRARRLDYNRSDLHSSSGSGQHGWSVRCIKD